jgi:hypothetical protein
MSGVVAMGQDAFLRLFSAQLDTMSHRRRAAFIVSMLPDNKKDAESVLGVVEDLLAFIYSDDPSSSGIDLMASASCTGKQD